MIRLILICFLIENIFLAPAVFAQSGIAPEKTQKKRRRRRRKKRRIKKEVQQVVEDEPETQSPVNSLTYPQFSYDFGISLGSYASRSYTEANLGLNTHFDSWLVWRNAFFARFVQDSDNIYGIDTSLRGVFDRRSKVIGLTAFTGPGYRLVSQGSSAFFVEGGVILRMPILTIGGGAKVLLLDTPTSGGANTDTIYFLILSGSGGF